MTRTKLIDRQLPDYTRGEEIFNMVSHITGGAFGIAALVLCVVYSVACGNLWGFASGMIYGISMIMLYTMSSIYHGLTGRLAKIVFQIIDHCTIFLLIAGTYTPILLTGIRESKPALAWTLFGIIWGGSVLGTVFTAIDLKKYKVFSMICYMTIGWCIVFALKPLLECYDMQFFAWILAGGVAYTLGTVLYGLGSKGYRYTHSVFHLFVILGSILQFVGIFKYCILVR